MSKNINGIAVIYAEAEQQCDLCGNISELRSYGHNGECICYECGMKDEKTTDRMMAKVLFGVEDFER